MGAMVGRSKVGLEGVVGTFSNGCSNWSSSIMGVGAAYVEEVDGSAFVGENMGEESGVEGRTKPLPPNGVDTAGISLSIG